MHRMYKQGCQNTKLKRLFNKLFVKHFEIFKRLADNAESFVQLFGCLMNVSVYQIERLECCLAIKHVYSVQ